MGRYVLTREIAATPDQVFRAFTEPKLVADWMDAAAVVDDTGPLDVAGNTYALVIRGPWRFRTTVVRVERPWVHEAFGQGPLGTTFRMVATLSTSTAGTSLQLFTDYTMPLGILGRWIDRRWIDREPRSVANRELDRLVELVAETPSGETRNVGGDPLMAESPASH